MTLFYGIESVTCSAHDAHMRDKCDIICVLMAKHKYVRQVMITGGIISGTKFCAKVFRPSTEMLPLPDLRHLHAQCQPTSQNIPHTTLCS